MGSTANHIAEFVIVAVGCWHPSWWWYKNGFRTFRMGQNMSRTLWGAETQGSWAGDTYCRSASAHRENHAAGTLTPVISSSWEINLSCTATSSA